MAKITFSDMSRDELVEEMAEAFSIGQLRDALALAKAQLLEILGPEPIHVWCDGGCRYNGQPHAEAYFSWQTHIRGRKYGACRMSVSKVLPQTNNVAEYLAVIEALLWLKGCPWPLSNPNIVLHTDSLLVCGQLMEGWKRNYEHLSHLAAECDYLLKELEESGRPVRLVKEPRKTIEAVLGH